MYTAKRIMTKCKKQCKKVIKLQKKIEKKFHKRHKKLAKLEFKAMCLEQAFKNAML